MSADKKLKRCSDSTSSKYFPTNNKITKLESSACVEDFCNDKKRISTSDYHKPGLALAKYLLGKILCRVVDDDLLLAGRIVETEAYLGVTDKACHSFGNKKTARTAPMFMEGGTAYVYIIYGMYSCFNISSSDEGGCVLVRALEPLSGLDQMTAYRSTKRKGKSAVLKEQHLCNGPSKLCQSLNITKVNSNTVDLSLDNKLFMMDDGVAYRTNEIVVCKRIGIEGYGIESASLPYRFYVKGNKNVSSKDKEVEMLLEES